MRLVIVSLLALAAFACAASPAPAPSPPGAPPEAPPALGPPASTSPAPAAGASSNLHVAGEMCGGIAGFGCAAGLYCSFPPEAQCGAADQTGTCQPVPEMCTKEYRPVCGCDDKTYGNACGAAAAGVSVASQGECAAK